MTTSSTMLHIRIDEKIKQDAQLAFQAMGISMPEAIRLFLTRVIAEQAIPFQVKVPNKTTLAAMQEVEQIIQEKKARFHHSDDLFHDLEKNSKF